MIANYGETLDLRERFTKSQSNGCSAGTKPKLGRSELRFAARNEDSGVTDGRIRGYRYRVSLLGPPVRIPDFQPGAHRRDRASRLGVGVGGRKVSELGTLQAASARSLLA